MQLNLVRPLLFFDIESTGLSIATDSIAELSFVKVFPDGEQRVKTWRVKPWDYEKRCQRPVSPGAAAVNGIKDEDLAGCPKFFDIVDEVVEWLRDSDLAGFNSAKFDLPMLAEEIERVRHYCKEKIENPASGENTVAMAREKFAKADINLHDKHMIDVQTIYHVMEPRNLKAAYRFYCGGKDFENAHTAEADTIATYEVLKAQLDRYSEPDDQHQQVLKNDVEFLAGFGGRPRNIDYAGRLILDDNGDAVVNFGKYKGRRIKDVWKSDPSYFSWIEHGEFTLDTKRQFATLKEQIQKEEKAARSKPLDDKELDAAKELLFKKFSQG